MTSPELEDYARLWRGEESAEEQRVFRRLAWRVGIKARALRFADYGLAALILIATVVAMTSDTTPATLLFGVLLGIAVVWGTWKRRVLHQTMLLGAIGSRETMIGAARERCRIELGQSRWGLLLFPLSIFAASAMKFSALTGGHVERFVPEFIAAVRHGDNPLLILLLLVLGEAYFLYRSRRLRSELRVLDLLGEQYRREASLDRADGDAGA